MTAVESTAILRVPHDSRSVGVVGRVEEGTGPPDRARDDVARSRRGDPGSRRRDRGRGRVVTLELGGSGRRHPRGRDADRDDGEQADEEESEASCHRPHPTPGARRDRPAGMLRSVATTRASDRGPASAADDLVAAIIVAPARYEAPDRADRPRVVPPRRDAVPPGRPAAGGRLPDDDRRGRRARPDRRRASRPGRPARRRHRPVGWRFRDRGRPDHRLHGDGQDPRDRPGEPGRGRPAGRHQLDPEGRGRRRGPVLPARPGQLRDVLDRRQPRHERRRPVLRQVRPDARFGPVARGRHGRRDDPPDRRPEHQGRRRLLADPPVRRQPGHARDHDRGDPQAPAGAAAPPDDAGLLPDARIGR